MVTSAAVKRLVCGTIRAGEKIDDTAKKVGEKIEEAGDKIKDAAKDAEK